MIADGIAHEACVRPSPGAGTALRPVGAADVTIHSGFWGDRLRINRERTIPHGFDRLRATGTLNNLQLAAGAGHTGTYRASGDTSGAVLPFLDSDVYKWLEAVGWELGRDDDAELRAAADEAIGIVARAQRQDGYLNSFVTVLGGRQYADLAWGHELYCLGHLVQAAVAWHRALGDDRLLDIALRAVAHADRALGPSGADGIDGHPEIEMALVELTRVTGDESHLDFAARMLDLRGHGIIGEGRFGSTYWQDHLPVREAAEVAGHSVRQLYLDCGAVDVAVERDDKDLLGAVRRRWDDMVRTRRYLTGSVGSRHRDEAFGDPYELPPDRAYAETCASIAEVMLGWRLLLATGESRYADDIERVMFNGVLPSLSRSGTEFFYVNPLQRRTHRSSDTAGDGRRAPWQACACCPPNLMRMLSTWEQYVLTGDGTGVQVHQYADASFRVSDMELTIATGYPWDGTIVVTVVRTPDRPWALSLRVPGWCRSATLTVGDGPAEAVTAGYATRSRTWRAGDRVVLDLELPVRLIEPHPRVDAVRGCVAFERGPIVYCIESADLPNRVPLEDVRYDSDGAVAATPRPDLGDGVVGIDVPAAVAGSRMTVPAIPYHTWGNRGDGGMRVWLPREALSADRA